MFGDYLYGVTDTHRPEKRGRQIDFEVKILQFYQNNNWGELVHSLTLLTESLGNNSVEWGNDFAHFQHPFGHGELNFGDLMIYAFFLDLRFANHAFLTQLIARLPLKAAQSEDVFLLLGLQTLQITFQLHHGIARLHLFPLAKYHLNDSL